MTKQLRAELAAYLEKYYIPPIYESVEGSVEYSNEEERSAEYHRPRLPSFAKDKQSLSSDQAKSLNDLMDELGVSFHEKLFELIDASGMTDADVYKRANLDRKLFSKIRSNPAYHPRKATVLALVIALRLDIKDANDLLACAEYAFSPGSKSDLIIKFFIEHRVYDIDAINYTLEEYHQPILN